MEIQLPCAPSAHPVNMQKYIVPTPSIEALYMQVRKCIRMKVPGGIVYAFTRFGKTYAIRYIKGMLRQDYPGIFTFRFGCRRHKVPSESAFFSMLLEAVRHPKSDTGTIKVLRHRLMQFLVDRMAVSPFNFFVVFADEAQKLEKEEYEWLREIHDDLEEMGYRMITFLVGQPQLKNQKDALKSARETQIVGRFMIDEFSFRGVTSVNDAASCLQGFDTALYPPNSDWTFTRYFLPRAWACGFKLEGCAPQLWAEFDAVHQEGGFQQALEIPMTYFARSIEILLTTVGPSLDAPDFRVTPEVWKSVVKESRFAQSEDELLTEFVDDQDLE